MYRTDVRVPILAGGAAHAGDFSYSAKTLIAIENDPGLVHLGVKMSDGLFSPVRIDVPAVALDELAAEWLYHRGLLTNDELIEIRGRANNYQEV